MIRLPLYLVLLILPLAVAGHHIGATVAGLILFAQIYQRRHELEWATLRTQFKVPFLASFAYLAVLVASTVANPLNPDRWDLSPVLGHLTWVFLPPVVYLAQPPLSHQDWQRLYRFLAFVTLVIGGVAASQAIWGWKLVGAHIVFASTRAQGFYSHPLTFAYVCLIVFPLGALGVCRWPRLPASWVIFGSMAVAIAASQSRTVQMVSAGLLFINIFMFTKGRFRWALLLGAGLAVSVTLATHNRISERFFGMLVRHDVRSDYADDRLAFWRANFDMVTERPLLGHGEGLDSAYRKRYYAEIGLGDFDRQYEAHNMYLQLAVNGGLIGLGVFLLWLGWHLVFAARRGGASGLAAREALLAFAVAACTQNAFQDSEVRYALTLVCTALWLASKAPRGEPAQALSA